MNTAIITGASSGVGEEFFNVVKNDPSIEEIWLIARRADKLEMLAKQTDKKVCVLPYDLTDNASFESIKTLLEEKTPDIRLLINNAGFGKLGNVYELDCESQTRMIALNNSALTAMCAICTKYMKKGSSIINVASIAAFAPNPRMAVYCSTKAYVLSFTKCIREELKPLGINALAVCPGPMATEFLDVAGISGGKSKTFETLPYCDPAKVAKGAVKYAKHGKGVYTPRAFYKFYRFLAKILPHSFVMKFSKT